MPAAKKLKMDETQRKRLEAWAKNPPKAYLRRKARALLLAAEGQPAYQIAQDRHVHANRATIGVWIRAFEEKGMDGLRQAKGQGRKPRFFPTDAGAS
jgi:transposase